MVAIKMIEGTHAAERYTYRLPPSIKQWLNNTVASLPAHVRLNLWGMELLAGKHTERSLDIEIRHPGVIRELILRRDPLVIVEAYIAGLLDFEGDLRDMSMVTCRIPASSISPLEASRIWFEALSIPALPRRPKVAAIQDNSGYHSEQSDKAAIQAHYDLGNEFYKLWLDPRLVYSCAYFEDANMSLAKAQESKLDLICRKLRLQPGQSFMDIGCGWGALLRWAAEHYGVTAYGITLSEKQLLYNQQWIAEAGLKDKVQVELRDYRDLPSGSLFDKVVSVGMIEHVGIKNYPAYFKSIYSALKPGGLFLNHGITTSTTYDHHGFSERFINRYVFPDGELASLPQMTEPISEAGWEVVDIDCWRTHYAKTLQCWFENFQKIEKQAAEFVGPEKAQIWKLYLNGSAIGFADNQLSVYQILLRRAADKQWDLPFTRARWLS